MQKVTERVIQKLKVALDNVADAGLIFKGMPSWRKSKEHEISLADTEDHKIEEDFEIIEELLQEIIELIKKYN